MALEVLLYSFSILAISLSIVPRINKNFWWIRGFEFPHIQFTFLSIIVFVSLLCFGQLSIFSVTILIFLGLTIIYQVSVLLPYSFFYKKEVRGVHTLREENVISFLTYNVFIKNKNYQALKETINQEKPDVIALFEPDVNWQKSMKSLESDYSYSVEVPKENTCGMLLYSKVKIVNQEVLYLIEEDVPSIHATLELKNGCILKLYCVHPIPPSPTENYKSDPRDAELRLISELSKRDLHPTVVTGDLNDVPWSRTFKKYKTMSKLSDPRIGRGMYSTFHTRFPLLRWPLDYLLVSEQFELLEFGRLKNIGSDHFPLFTKLMLTTEVDKKGMHS